METIDGTLQNSVYLGIYHLGRQGGFTHLVTDKATFTCLADVFVDQAFRGQGLGKWIKEIILHLLDECEVRSG
ncbi:MAG: hypothetical protein SVP52_03990 [Chloroflexota bacterium]|nr:hypothetical protein [Chloroflexota bacterium]